MSIARWYAVHVFTQHEQKVKTLIEKLAKKQNMQDRIQQVIIPVVKMVMDDNTWNLVKRTEYVTNFVCSTANKPVPIKDSEVKRILESLDPNRGFKPKKTWAKDMLIRVSDGPFIDLTGKIDIVDDEKQKLKVMINLFGRETPVELTYDQVEKI
jgi:transcriptional antiterminator NusG